jgi:hypothetical protein
MHRQESASRFLTLPMNSEQCQERQSFSRETPIGPLMRALVLWPEICKLKMGTIMVD